MRHKMSVFAIAIVCGSGVLLAAADQRGAGQPLLSRKGLPLAALIKPGTGAEVIVQKDQSPPLFIEPGEPRLESMAKRTPYVFIGTVVSTHSSLTPDKDWVTSTVELRVEDVLKRSAKAIAVGQTIAFEQDGGNILIGAAMVKAVVSWAENFEEAQRYLIFADGPYGQSDDWHVLAYSSYKIGPDSSLKSMAKEGRAVTADAGLSLVAATSRIRSVVK